MATERSARQGMIAQETLAALRGIVGDKGLVDDPAALAPYLREERGRFHGRCAVVVRPATTEEVARVVAVCAAARLPIVPHGGNTGLVGGGVPEGGVVLATDRLNRIRAVDPINRAITVEAGVILSEVQAAADAVHCLFPLSLAAEGSCRIGGNLATNAGGITVLRYGNARDLVLGLEVVLPDGRVWDGLTALRKNNTGYDLKHLFIGAEGTLGVITAAVLKLFAKPRVSETALVACDTIEAVIALYQSLSDAVGDALTAFELVPRLGLEFCLRHIPGVVDPFAAAHPWYALIKLTSPRANDPLREALETVLGQAFEGERIADAVIAASDAQAQALWRMRESLPEAQKPEGGSIKNDVSVPISRVALFIARASEAAAQAVPGIRPVPFGHVGDGNIHFNLSQPPGADRGEFLARWDEIEALIAEIAHGLGGSFSAEHGIGQMKLGLMARHKSPVELDLMRRVKRALDPDNVMNPGKVVIP